MFRIIYRAHTEARLELSNQHKHAHPHVGKSYTMQITSHQVPRRHFGSSNASIPSARAAQTCMHALIIRKATQCDEKQCTVGVARYLFSPALKPYPCSQ